MVHATGCARARRGRSPSSSAPSSPLADRHPRKRCPSAPRPNGTRVGMVSNLFYRDIGQGPPTLVLHGGPDFDHRYLLPELDRLSDALRLIYYDQRGRGWSAPEV